MRKLYEQLKAALEQFVNQRDCLLLLVPCGDNDLPLLLKALRDTDRESASDLFLLFGHTFASQEDFVSNVAAHLQDEHQITNESAASEESELPPLPEDLLEASKEPAERLETGLWYGRSLIDQSLGQHAVWGFCPASITDPISWYSLLARLLPKEQILPWMRGTRIVARVPAGFQLEFSPFANARYVQVQPFSIPSNVHEEELLATAADANTPDDERSQAEVQLAVMDYSYGRFDIANQRYLKALAYYQWAEVSAMEGFVICGLGDVARAQGNWHDAQHWYECAIVPAAKAGNPMLLANIVQNLAVAAYVEGRFDEAEERYSELVTLKRAMIDEVGLVEALEWQGLSQENQQAYDRAIQCWEEAALICRSFDINDREPGMLAHLRRGYEALGMREELETFDAEWAIQGETEWL
jgi:tetratricopeptide (TPR) repeat protein